MGRWTDKIANTSSVELTKLTKPSSVSFVSSAQVYLPNKCITEPKFSHQEFIDAIQLICNELNIETGAVLIDLLSLDDEDDFIGGYLSVDQLRGFIKLWMKGR